MDNHYWSTDTPHFDNSETMQDYIEFIMDDDIELVTVDGTYAEIRKPGGALFAIHAGGNGDSYNHVITFERLS